MDRVNVVKILYCISIICTIALTCCSNVIEDIENENIERVKNIDNTKVRRIAIYLYTYQYKYKNKKFEKALTKKPEISEFLNCMKTLIKVYTNHPHYPNSWYVVIEFFDGGKEEVMIMQRKGVNDKLYVNCIGHSWIGNAGEAVSSELNEWMKSNDLLRKERYIKDNDDKVAIN